ncbi:Holliday junction resolvase RuvX [filamentous cyanobacterium CCP5]|nr:Holliday junction resolvase RuvX [filamentous cyanobacterium CCP5]
MAHISALGLDIGSRRIGVAGCDRSGLIATGLTTLESNSLHRLISALEQIVQERQGQVLVVGLPYTMDGDIGPQARRIQKMAGRLSKALNLPVEYADERLTSVEAEQMLIAEGRSPRDHKGLVDRKAAALILQQWLDQRERPPSGLSLDRET